MPIKCIICRKISSKNINDNGASHFKCVSCESGFVCDRCINNFDPSGSIYISDYNEVKQIIKCPCCKIVNWKYHYNQIMKISLGCDMFESETDNESHKYFIRQSRL